MTALAKIHIAKKQLGLDDDTYRDLLERVTGKRSAKGLTHTQINNAIAEFERLGWKPTSRKRNSTSEYLGKVQALWIAGWNLGIVTNRTDHAMNAFIKRQTGIDHARWLIHAGDAARVIEALKGWLARDGDVDWSAPLTGQPGFCANPRYKVAVAQWLKLRKLGAVHVGKTWTGNPVSVAEDLFKYGFKVTGKEDVGAWETRDWITLMNALGAKLRKAMAEKTRV